jgi:hypothetical protein
MNIQIEDADHVHVFDVADGGISPIRARQKRFFVGILRLFVRFELITDFFMRFFGCGHSIIVWLA